MTTSIRLRIGDLAATAAIAIVGAVYIAWACTDQIGLITGDGPNYLMMAKSYAHEGNDRVAAEVTALSRFPPLYPLVVARAGGAASLPVAHAITVVCLVLALGALFVWQRACGLTRDVAMALVLVISAIPDIWLAALSIQSEYLYLFFSLAAIALLTALRSSHREAYLYGAALAIMLAILTRTIGIVLLLPFLAALWNTQWRQRVVALATVLFPLGLWYGLHHARGGGYASALGDYFGGRSSAEVANLFVQQFSTLRAGLAKALLLQPQYLNPLADVVGILMVSSAVVRACRREPDGLYVCGYLALLMLWPYPGDAHRLIWPILPFALVQPVLLARDLGASQPRERACRGAAALCATVVLTMALPSITHAWQRSDDIAATNFPGINKDPTWYWPDRSEAIRFASAEYALVEALKRVGTLVPAGDCVISIRPDWINYYADRRSESPLPQYAPEAAFNRALQGTGCRFIFMSPFLDRMYSKPMYPLERVSRNIAVIDQNLIPNSSPAGDQLEFILAQYNP